MNSETSLQSRYGIPYSFIDARLLWGDWFYNRQLRLGDDYNGLFEDCLPIYVLKNGNFHLIFRNKVNATGLLVGWVGKPSNIL